jgi:hypothetical protein
VNIILVWGANSEADYNWLRIYQKGGDKGNPLLHGDLQKL